MSSSRPDVGPHVVIAGAARSGTTQLAARLALHPAVDACAVKEPNYFSREFHRGPVWYDSYFSPREPARHRLDASVSYTFPQFPEALTRLAEASPDVFVVYVVRDPIPRAVSHYLLYRYYFGHEKARDFGMALRARDFYLEVSDYERWLGNLHEHFAEDRLLVVPFQALTSGGDEVANEVFRSLGLQPLEDVDEAQVQAHQNNVVTFRSPSARRLTRTLRHSPLYPTVRRVLGPRTVKRVRSLLTRVPDMPSLEQALASCDARQRAAMEQLRQRAEHAVAEELAHQDRRRHLDWTGHWATSGATP